VNAKKVLKKGKKRKKKKEKKEEKVMAPPKEYPFWWSHDIQDVSSKLVHLFYLNLLDIYMYLTLHIYIYIYIGSFKIFFRSSPII
jgi:hypothetical protein